jgi:hypothetical protein
MLNMSHTDSARHSGVQGTYALQAGSLRRLEADWATSPKPKCSTRGRVLSMKPIIRSVMARYAMDVLLKACRMCAAENARKDCWLLGRACRKRAAYIGTNSLCLVFCSGTGCLAVHLKFTFNPTYPTWVSKFFIFLSSTFLAGTGTSLPSPLPTGSYFSLFTFITQLNHEPISSS